MKKLFIFSIVLLHYTWGNAQGLHPSSMSCFQPFVYMHPDFFGSYSIKREFSSNNCVVFNETTPTGNLIREGKTNVIAGQSIHIMENMHIGFAGAPPVPGPPGESTDAEFHAFIGHNDFDVFWYEPNSTVGTVGKFEKLELGLRIPEGLRISINNFVAGLPSTDKINPFDPEDISVEAEFYFLGDLFSIEGAAVYKKVYGFYYKEYYTPGPDDPGWIETDTIHFPFRIRFAPDKVGNWAVKIKITTFAGTLTTLPVNFYCAESSNPGFLRVGPNKRFLALGEQSFVPVGTTLAHPTVDASGAEPYLANEMPPKGYIQYREGIGTTPGELENLKANGANYYRMLIGPWATDIEFEHLGNYSERMDNAWEMDRILDKTKELGLYMHLNFQFHYNLENPTFYGMWKWDWPANSKEIIDPGHLVHPTELFNYTNDVGYCYSTELGLSEPKDFFTNADAIKHYKNKIRYMISRWGYSTSIGVMELYSEIDNAESVSNWNVVTSTTTTSGYDFKNMGTTRPYWHFPLEVNHIEAWQKDIAKYIKIDLQHKEHLISADYTGGHGPSSTGEGTNLGTGIYSDIDFYGPDVINDETYGSEYIDIMCWSNYKGASLNRFNELSTKQVKSWYEINNKPIILSEIGTSTGTPEFGTLDCDNNTEFIRSIWCSAFSGTAGTGLEYNGLSHDTYNNWHYYNILNNFLYGNTFAFDNWEPVHDLRDDNLAEMFALVNNTTNEEAMGIVVNRTYNFYTQSTSLPCHNAGLVDLDYQSELPIVPSSPFNLKLDLSPGDYLFQWTNALNGESLESTICHSPLIGKLEIIHPVLDLSGFPEKPILAFKATKLSFHSLQMDDSSQIESSKSDLFSDFYVQPNPASSSISVLTKNVYSGEALVKILNSNLSTVFVTKTTATNFNIDISTFENGIYFITVQDNKNVMTKKIVIQHGKD